MFQICFRFLKSEEKLWCVRDACGIGCAVATYLLLLFGQVVVTLTVLLPYPTASTVLQYLIFTSLVFLACCSHVRTMLTDPGTVPRGISEFSALQDCEETDNTVIKHCHKCNSIKPMRAHHCSVCKRCIRKMDHHCPWVNNCVGENNQKYFVLFTLYICTLSIFAVYMVASRAYYCSLQHWQGCLLFNAGAVYVLMIMLVMEGFLFSFFCFAMFTTQICGIISDETGIEKMKAEGGWQKKSIYGNFQHVCGGRITWLWLSPFTLSHGRRKGNFYRLMP